MTSVSSLSRCFTWQGAAELLDLPCDRATLPAITLCPACRTRQLTVYHDPIFGGEWMHCRQCNDHGDIVDLAARTWKLDRRAAAVKLGRFPQVLAGAVDLTTYLQKDAQLTARRKAVDAFWEDARTSAGITEDASLRDLLQRFSILRSMTAGEWHDTGGRLVGVTTHTKIEQTLRHRTHHRHAVLRGPNWGSVLTIPFYDLPGRICGFLFIGRKGREEDTVYHPIFSGHPDCGVGLLPALFGKLPPDETGRVYHFADARFGLRMQMRWLRSSRAFLPIVLTRPQTTGLLWQSLAARQHVFCTATLDADVIRQSRRAGGKLVTFAPNSEDEQNRGPLHWLQRLRVGAKPWRTALEQRLRAASPEECDAVLMQVGFTREELLDFVHSCDRKLQQKLQQTVLEQQSFRQVRYRNVTVTESAAGWSVNGRIIVNGTICLERLIKTGRQRDYRGYIRIGAHEIPLAVSASRLRSHGLLACAARIAEEAGHVLTYDPAWNNSAARIAQFFHRPQVTLGTGRIGWHDELNGFRLAHFNLLCGGRTDLGYNDLPRSGLPTRQLLPPSAVLTRTIDRLLKPDPAAWFFWAGFCTLVREILAPAHRQQPEPVAVLGDAAGDHFRRIAEAVGCDVLPQGEPRLAGLQEHRWPIVTAIDGRRKVDAAGGIYVCPADCLAAAELLGWSRLTVADDTLPPAVSPASLQSILPQYLQDLCRRNLALVSADCGFTGILADVSDWLARGWDQGLVTDRVAEFFQPTSAERRGRALLRAIRPRTADPATVVDKGPMTLLSHQRLQSANLPCGWKPGVYEVTQLLQAAGLLHDSITQSGFWTIPSEQWQSALQVS